MSLGIALRAFFAALGNKQKAEQISRVLSGKDQEGQPKIAETKVSETVKPRAETPAVAAPVRDSAITLLATLQREARLVDLIREDLGQYSDAQVGAAARPCLTQCAGVLDRLLGLQPLLVASEGELVDVGENASPTRYQWIGEGTSERGKLVHHGWQASKVDFPTWTGDAADAKIIAAAQIQAP